VLVPTIAGHSEPRFIEVKPEPRTKLRRTNDWLFIKIQRERRGGGKVPFTEEQLAAHGRRTDGRGISEEDDPERAYERTPPARFGLPTKSAYRPSAW
jgi:hypothetical protein